MRASDVRAGPQVCVQSNKVRHGVSEIGFEDCTRASSLHRGRATLPPCTPLWLPRYRAVAIRTRTVPSPELFLGLLPGDLAPLRRHVRPPPQGPHPHTTTPPLIDLCVCEGGGGAGGGDGDGDVCVVLCVCSGGGSGVCVCVCVCGVVCVCVAWYGMLWYGMVWCGIVWHGMTWCGMAWHGMV